MKRASKSVLGFVALVVASSVTALALNAGGLKHADMLRFLAILVLASAASRTKVKLPGLEGTMTMNLPFLLLAIVEFNTAQAMIIAGISSIVHGLPGRGKKASPLHILFNAANLMIATFLASVVLLHGAKLLSNRFELVGLAVIGYFVVNSCDMAIVMALDQGAKLFRVWGNLCLLTLPYFVLSAGMAVMAGLATSHVGWPMVMVTCLVMFGVYQSYRVYFGEKGVSPELAIAQHAMAAAAK